MVVLPVTLIAGYLGAGKTTLVNHLLRHNGGRRLAVLVNDFGDINIDADLIEAQADDIISLAGGCVCCSFGSDLMGALARIVDSGARFDHVLIETSGVALPGAVVLMLRLVSGLHLDATLVLADASTIREQADDRYVGDMVQTQLLQADLIVLNKADLISEAELNSTRAWLTARAPKATVLTTCRAEGVAALVFSLQDPEPPASVEQQPTLDRLVNRTIRSVQPVSAGKRFSSLTLPVAHPVDPHRLATLLSNPGLNLLRAKGFVHDSQGIAHQIQLVGARAQVAPLTRSAPAAAQLVMIGLAGQLNRANLLAALSASRVDRDKIAP